MVRAMSKQFSKIVVDFEGRFFFRVLPASARVNLSPCGFTETREEAEAEADKYMQEAIKGEAR